ncbi:MAG: C39 family peptidase [Clostridia bacterium]|nr:C39 family peptidase [Clostridia bacterium]
MKKYVSCAVLILLCLICAMVFYVNASDLWQGAPNEEVSTDTSTQTGGDSSLENDPELENELELSGTIYSEYLSSYALRIEWFTIKPKNDSSTYLSVELYLDSPDTITKTGNGYLVINDVKKEFSSVTAIGTSTLVTTHTQRIDEAYGNELNIEAFLALDLGEENLLNLTGITANGKVLLEEQVSKDSHLIELEHISQFPSLPSGDEITSLAMVLKYLKYDISVVELCDLYLEKGPVGYTSPFVANVGNPTSTYNSFGCMPPVLVKTTEKFVSANGGSFVAKDLTGVNAEALYSFVSQDKPVIVWACEDFDINPQISRVWVIDGETVYVKSNISTMVLIGYDYEKGTVTLADPAGTIFDIDMDLFEMRFSQMGAYAVLID